MRVFAMREASFSPSFFLPPVSSVCLSLLNINAATKYSVQVLIMSKTHQQAISGNLSSLLDLPRVFYFYKCDRPPSGSCFVFISHFPLVFLGV